MNAITIGKFTLQAELLTFFITIFAVSILYKAVMQKSLSDWYYNAIILYIVIYKLSYITFQFDLFIKTPLSILYFDGGWKGQVLAFIGLAIYLVMITTKRYELLKSEFIPTYFIFVSIYSLLQQAFLAHYVVAFINIMFLGTFIWIYLKSNVAHENQLFIFLLLVQAILLSFSSGLSITHILMLSLGVILFILKKLKGEEQRL